MATPTIADATRVLPCTDGSAYVSLLSIHDSGTLSTQLAGMVARGRLKAKLSGAAGQTRYDPVQVQLRLILVLVRSLRRVELCRRDFVLIGTHPHLDTQWRTRLQREGVQFMSTSPIVLGNPSTDKLHAWRLSRYKKVLVVDSDVMALRPLDDVFSHAPEFVAAHHASDFAQSRCGLPVERRMIGALFALKPSAARFSQLVSAVKSYAANSPELYERYSEQVVLACELKNSSTVLPCGWLYDTHSPMSTSCRSMVGSRSPEVCLRAFHRACVRHNNIFTGQAAREQACDGAVQHMKANCLRAPGAAPVDIRALHFKGANKPWTARSRDCEKVRDGFMLRAADVGHATPANASVGHAGLVIVDPLLDEVNWDAGSRVCHVQRAGGQISPLLWASGELVQHERCCSFWLVVSAHWFGLLDTLRARMYSSSRGRCASGMPELPSNFATRPRLKVPDGLWDMNRLRDEAIADGAVVRVGRWCCQRSCGVCRQEQGCRKRPGGALGCCPARMLQKLRSGRAETCNHPSSAACLMAVPLSTGNLSDEIWGY